MTDTVTSLTGSAVGCAGGHHWYVRDRSQPDDRQWTCARSGCGAVAPVQPGTGRAGQGLGWPT